MSAAWTMRDVARTGATVLIAAIAAALATVAGAAGSSLTASGHDVASVVAAGTSPTPPVVAKNTATAPSMAIVLRDQTALRAAPRDSAPQQAVLWQGEALEVRGERLDYLQVWDHVRERGGFVRASQVHRSRLGAADAPGLLTLVTFTRQSSGNEALGIGLTAAYLQAAPADALRGAAARRLAVYSRNVEVPKALPSRRMPDDPAAAAHELFAVLRAFDDEGVQLLWVEAPPPDDVAWDGVRDRLQRAAAG